MSDPNEPAAGQLEDDWNQVFQAQLALLDPREERQWAELGMADYAALVAEDDAVPED